MPVTHDYVPVDEWYAQQGTEHPAHDDTIGLAYAYKLVRERGQTNNAVVYVLKGSVLYKITLQEQSKGVTFTGINEGGPTYTFSKEYKRMLESFRIK